MSHEEAHEGTDMQKGKLAEINVIFPENDDLSYLTILH